MFTELEGAAFAKERVVVRAGLTDGFGQNVFQAKTQTRMLYWSVQIVQGDSIEEQT